MMGNALITRKGATQWLSVQNCGETAFSGYDGWLADGTTSLVFPEHIIKSKIKMILGIYKLGSTTTGIVKGFTNEGKVLFESNDTSQTELSIQITDTEAIATISPQNGYNDTIEWIFFY